MPTAVPIAESSFGPRLPIVSSVETHDSPDRFAAILALSALPAGAAATTASSAPPAVATATVAYAVSPYAAATAIDPPVTAAPLDPNGRSTSATRRMAIFSGLRERGGVLEGVLKLRELVWLAWMGAWEAGPEDAPAFQEALATFARGAGLSIPPLYWVRGPRWVLGGGACGLRGAIRANLVESSNACNAWSLPALGAVACSPTFLRRFRLEEQREVAAHEIAHLALGHRRSSARREDAADALAARWCGRETLRSRLAYPRRADRKTSL